MLMKLFWKPNYPGKLVDFREKNQNIGGKKTK